MNDFLAPGKQEIDLTVYAKVAAYETLKQEGVVRLNAGFTEKLGIGRTPGVSVRLEEDGALQLDISVVVRYGADLRNVGPAIQEAVLNSLRQMSDQPVGQINVYIADIEFSRGAAKSAEEDPLA